MIRMLLVLTPVLLLASFVSLSGCADDDIAGECDSNEDCATGLCYTESTPGYCTALCSVEGSTDECPAHTICKNIVGGPSRCLLVCETDADCPTNSDCNAVDGSELRGCEPVR